MISYVYVLLAGMVLGYFLGKISYRKEASGYVHLTEEQASRMWSYLEALKLQKEAKSSEDIPVFSEETPPIEAGWPGRSRLPTEVPSASLCEAGYPSFEDLERLACEDPVLRECLIRLRDGEVTEEQFYLYTLKLYVETNRKLSRELRMLNDRRAVPTGFAG